MHPVSSHSVSKHQSITTQNLVLTGMFAGVLAVISQISIPMPTGVPVTIQLFGIALVGTVLGWKMGCMATLVYIGLGCIGLPIFANFQGGMQTLVGMTGGYIMAWPVLAALSGIRIKNSSGLTARMASVILALAGVMVVEIVGGFQWSLLTSEMSFGAIMAYSLVAFIPKDMIITILAVIVGNQIHKSLVKAGLLQ